MSSLSLSQCFLASRSSVCPLQVAPSPSSYRRRVSRISCSRNKAADDSDERRRPSGLIMDRRDVLVALGGLYGAAGKAALAAPIAPPDFKACHPATSRGLTDEELKCCPPLDYSSLPIKEYTFPKTPLRVRPAAHLVDDEYLAKYKEAVTKMKALPDDDPWNFYQQAKIHCAYCNDSYYQSGYEKEKVNLNVHGSWIFLPWHRYYLYFYERILGNLIGDNTFALPFWNYDSPDGMTLPSIFLDQSSSIYNPNRNPDHLPPTILDYRHSNDGTKPELEGDALKEANVQEMRSAFLENLNKAELFMGQPQRAGETPAAGTRSAGACERIHNVAHQWVGTTETGNRDMGNLATAPRDSVFYCLHSNVDRLWQIYRTLRGKRPDFTDTDYLDASFVFYDENRELVNVKVKDSVEISKLGYTYQEVPLPWLGKVSRRKKKAAETKVKAPLSLVPVPEFGSEPKKLDSIIRVMVPRPKLNRTKDEKEDQLEVLSVAGIVVNDHGPARFDVYIAKPYGELAGPDLGTFVGSYVKLSHKATLDKVTAVKAKVGDNMKSMLHIGITIAVEDMGADGEEKLVVSVKPRLGDVTIGGVRIGLVDADHITN